MNIHRTFAAVASAALLTLAACGSDDKPSADAGGDSGPVTTRATTSSGSPSGDLPGGGSLPGGLSGECAAVAVQLGSLFSGSVTKDAADDLFDKVSGAVPSDLKDDITVLRDAYGPYVALVSKYNGDPTKVLADSEAQGILAKLASDPKVVAAQTAVSDYFARTCNTR